MAPQSNSSSKALTKEEVESAVDQLILTGEKVSVRSVRKELGDYGSFGDIAAFLKQIREERAALTSSAYAKIPPEAVEAFIKFFQQVKSQAGDEYREQEEKFTQNIDELSAELEEQQGLISTLETQVKVADREKAELIHQYADYRKRANKTEEALLSVSDKLKEKELLLSQMEGKLTQQASEHKLEMQALTEKAVSEERLARSVLEKVQARLDAELVRNEKLEEKTTTLSTQLLDLRAEHTRAESTIAHAQQQLKAAQALTEEQLPRIQRLDAELAITTDRYERAKTKIEELQEYKASHDALMLQNTKLEAQLEVLSKQLKAAATPKSKRSKAKKGGSDE